MSFVVLGTFVLHSFPCVYKTEVQVHTEGEESFRKSLERLVQYGRIMYKSGVVKGEEVSWIVSN